MIEMRDEVAEQDDPALPLLERIGRAVDDWRARYQVPIPLSAVLRGLVLTEQQVSETVIASSGAVRLVSIGQTGWGLTR